MPNQVTSALLRSARSYAGQLSSLVKSFAPNHLQGGIKVHADEPTEGRVVIHIEAKGPDAHAQEYGSGLHTDARKGTKAKYPILPVKGQALAFRENARGTWDYTQGNPPPIPKYYTLDGRGLFWGVLHPGINKYQGKGYIAPAIRKFRTDINKKGSGLRQELRQAFLGEIKKGFKGGDK